MTSLDSFKCQKTLKVGGKDLCLLQPARRREEWSEGNFQTSLFMKVLLENLLRNEDGRTVKKDDIVAFSKW